LETHVHRGLALVLVIAESVFVNRVPTGLLMELELLLLAIVVVYRLVKTDLVAEPVVLSLRYFSNRLDGGIDRTSIALAAAWPQI